MTFIPGHGLSHSGGCCFWILQWVCSSFKILNNCLELYTKRVKFKLLIGESKSLTFFAFTWFFTSNHRNIRKNIDHADRSLLRTVYKLMSRNVHFYSREKYYAHIFNLLKSNCKFLNGEGDPVIPQVKSHKKPLFKAFLTFLNLVQYREHTCNKNSTGRTLFVVNF